MPRRNKYNPRISERSDRMRSIQDIPRQKYSDEHAGDVSRHMNNLVRTMTGNANFAKRAARRIHRPSAIYSRMGSSEEEEEQKMDEPETPQTESAEPGIKRVILRQDTSGASEPCSGGSWKWILASVVSLLLIGLIVFACTRGRKK